ncbi:MAG: hypothetical protein IJ806_05665 [Ruminococcus sp.]|nr:hypothetical protein [Ruminococcus sp.]
MKDNVNKPDLSLFIYPAAVIVGVIAGEFLGNIPLGLSGGSIAGVAVTLVVRLMMVRKAIRENRKEIL